MNLESALSSKKNLDLHLDNEFIFLAQFIRIYKNRVPSKDEARCVAWLQKLLAPTRDGTSRIVRNTYLAELLLAMQSGQLCGPFGKKPEKGSLSLSELQSDLHDGEVGEPPWLDTVINAPIPGNEEMDQRTYISTQAHPDGKSAYAYVAISTTDHDHWMDPSAASDNESTVNVTPPRSYAAPSVCNSCASVYPIPEEIDLPCPEDVSRCPYTYTQGEKSTKTEDKLGHCPYTSDPLICFYDGVLAHVQNVERTGCCSDDAFISDLMHRMKAQADPTLVEMSPEELEVEIIRRLKANLWNRREQARKMIRTNSASYQQEPHEDMPEDCVGDLYLSLDEELWESAARRELSPTNMILLESVYPAELVSRFVKALTRERCALISRMRAEHQVLVTSLRNDVEKDVEKSLDRFRKARALWVLLLRANQEVHHIKRQEMSSLAEADKGMAIRETVREIQDAMLTLDAEGKRGTDLADQLISEQQYLYHAERESDRHMRRLLAHNEALQISLETLEAHEASQLKRINELHRQLHERGQI